MKKYVFLILAIAVLFTGCDIDEFALDPVSQLSGYGTVAFGSSPVNVDVIVFDENGSINGTYKTLSDEVKMKTGKYYVMYSLENYQIASKWFEVKDKEFATVDMTMVIADSVYNQPIPVQFVHDTTIVIVGSWWFNANPNTDHDHEIPKATSFYSSVDGEVTFQVITNNNSFDEQKEEIVTARINNKNPLDGIVPYGVIFSQDPAPQENQYVKSYLGTFTVIKGWNEVSLYSQIFFNPNAPQHSVECIALIVQGKNVL